MQGLAVKSNLKDIIWFTASPQFAYRKLTSGVCALKKGEINNA